MYFRKTFLFLLLSFVIHNTGNYCLAQNLTVQGVVQDTASKKPLQYGVAMALRFNDSLLVAFTRSDKNGIFKLEGLPVDTYQVMITHPQFGEQSFILLGDKNNPMVNLQQVAMPPKSVTMKEVNIYGYKDAVFYKGDTLVYTADSFKVKQNAVVEDLLKKLPGIKVDAQGKIYAQGQAVDQVLVDGDEFFGSDPTVATKNLSAKALESVQVYDKKNESTTDNSDKETLKVMNLQLKEDAKKGFFGKVSAATDFDKYYEGEILANRFKGSQKISVFSLASNTPRSQFDWNDLWSYGLDNEMNSQTWDDGSTYYFFNNSQKGIPETFKTGFYFTDKPSKKIKISTNYSYNNSNVVTETGTRSQYFLEDTTYTTDNESRSKQRSEAHAVNLTLNYSLDSLTELEVQPKYKYSTGKSNAGSITDYITSSGLQSRKVNISNSSDNDAHDLTTQIKLTRIINNRDRKLTLNYNFGRQQSSTSGKLMSGNEYFLTPSTFDDDVNQKKTNSNSRLSNSLALTYTEPLSKKVKLEFSYDVSRNVGEQNKSTFDFVNGNYETENTEFSNDFRNIRTINRGGIKFIYEIKKQSFSAGAKARQVYAKNINLNSDLQLSQTVNNILPAASYRYKFSDNRSLSIRYTTDSKQPDLNQLQPVPDNSNPNNITLGNPSLRPTFSHRMNVNYNSYKPISGRSAWGGANFGYVQHDFANAIVYDSIGRTSTQTVNVNGNINASGYLNLNFPFFEKVLMVSPGVDFNYYSRSNFINNRENITSSAGGSAEMELTFNLENTEATIGGNYTYTDPRTTLNKENNKAYSDYGLRGSIEADVTKRFKVSSEANYTINRQRTEGYNINYIIWDASVSYAFLKKENLVVSVKAYDLLNQNINTYRENSDNVISDIRAAITGRYILVGLSYKFTSDKTEKSDDE